MIKKLIKSPTFLIIICALVFLFIRHLLNEKNAYYYPPYEYEKVCFSDSDAKIFKYTGLSPKGAEDIFKQGKISAFKKLNSLYFEKPDIKKGYILFPITVQESLNSSPTPLVPLYDGDILITFNTHTLDWRHGHAAIVTDAKEGIILEHMSVGNTSALSRAKKWGSYPAFAVLRYPDEEKAKLAAQYAKENLVDVPYSIFAGLIEKDKSKNETVSSSHCSHIVWQAYKAIGIDIDSNGGRIVTPKDIAKSKELKLVQIFGLNPKEFDNKLMK